jgi:nucleoside diphosphate kinase
MISFVDFSSKFWNILFLDLILKQISYEDQATLRQKIKFILKWTAIIVYILNCLLYIILGLKNMFTNLETVKIFMENFVYISVIFVTILKFTSIVCKRKRVQDLFLLLPSTYSQSELEDLNCYKISRNFKITCLIIKVYVLLVVSLAFCDKFFNVNQEQNIFNLNYNIKIENLILSNIFVLWIICSIFLITFIWLFVEIFMYGIIISNIIEFERLRFEILKFKIKLVEKEKANKLKQSLLLRDMLSTCRQNVKIIPQVVEVKSQAENLEILKKLIARHNELFAARNYIESLFSSSFFSNLAIGSFTCCIFAYMLQSVESYTETLIILLSLLTNVLYLFMQCYFSQLLNETSQSVADSVYETGWEEVADLRIRKNLQMIIMNNQRSIAFTNLNFSENNLELFRKVSYEI